MSEERNGAMETTTARTYRSYQDFTDPMLRAAAAEIVTGDFARSHGDSTKRSRKPRDLNSLAASLVRDATDEVLERSDGTTGACCAIHA
jgi:hypothetical protein